MVYGDANNNGRLDRGEPAAVSGRGGSYQLTMAPGTYTIRELAPSGWRVTSPSDGSYSVSVAGRATVTGRNFGNQRAVATVSGTAFNDQDGDGTRDTGELGQSGWQVFADADSDGQLDSGEPAAISGRDGSYQLTLTPGDYTIVEVAVSGWQVTAPGSGSYTVTVAIGDAVTGKDFGNQQTEVQPADSGDFQIDLSFSGLTASQQVIAQEAADRWEQVIVGDLSDVRYRGQTIDDVLITIRTQRMDGAGNVLGESGPEAMRTGGGLPFLGTVVIDTADIAQMESAGELLAVLTHEIAHVLGFGTLWTSQRLLTGTRTSNPLFTGAQAVAEYNAAFRTNATGVPVEANGGTGTALGHWRLSVFGGELMVGYIQQGGDMALSRITVAAMADIGYEVNLAAADSYSPVAASSSLASLASSAIGSTGSSVSTSGARPAAPTTVPGTVAVAPGPNWHHGGPGAWGSDSRPTSRTSFGSSRWQEWSAAVDDVFTMPPSWV